MSKADKQSQLYLPATRTSGKLEKGAPSSGNLTAFSWQVVITTQLPDKMNDGSGGCAGHKLHNQEWP